MGMEDAFAGAEAHYKAEVMAETWGHLAPKRNKTYRGRFVWVAGIYDSGELNPTVIVCEFPGLASSPWWYEALHEFIDKISWKPSRGYPNPRKGFTGEGMVYEVYEWVGTFRNYSFCGKVRLIFDANKTVDNTRINDRFGS